MASSARFFASLTASVFRALSRRGSSSFLMRSISALFSARVRESIFLFSDLAGATGVIVVAEPINSRRSAILEYMRVYLECFWGRFKFVSVVRRLA